MIGNVPFRGEISATGGIGTYPVSQNLQSAPSDPYSPPPTFHGEAIELQKMVENILRFCKQNITSIISLLLIARNYNIHFIASYL